MQIRWYDHLNQVILVLNQVVQDLSVHISLSLYTGELGVYVLVTYSNKNTIEKLLNQPGHLVFYVRLYGEILS